MMPVNLIWKFGMVAFELLIHKMSLPYWLVRLKVNLGK
jgi:hypothetical protein